MAKIHELYEDSYYENFTAGQYDDLRKAQVDLENTIPSRVFHIEHLCSSFYHIFRSSDMVVRARRRPNHIMHL